MLKHILPSAGSLSHASFVVNLEGAGRLREQETTQRARGFLFCASAAVLAAACSIREIAVYENGYGAINLPLSEGALSNGLSTRGAHPTFLRMISAICTDALSTDLTFILPFLWMTKADLVSELAKTPGLVTWAQTSHSCVHTSWRERNATHCGECPACIERHQAFLGAGVMDSTPYGLRKVWEGRDPLRNDYLRAYLDFASRWVNDDPRVFEHFQSHRVLSKLEDLDEERLITLSRRYATEALSVYGGLMNDARHESRVEIDAEVAV